MLCLDLSQRLGEIWLVISLNCLCFFLPGNIHIVDICWLDASYVFGLFTFSFLFPSFPLMSLFQNPTFEIESSFPSAWSHLLPVLSNILLTLTIRVSTPVQWGSQWSLVPRLHLCSDQNCFADLAALSVCICSISLSLSWGTIILKSSYSNFLSLASVAEEWACLFGGVMFLCVFTLLTSLWSHLFFPVLQRCFRRERSLRMAVR